MDANIWKDWTFPLSWVVYSNHYMVVKLFYNIEDLADTQDGQLIPSIEPKVHRFSPELGK